MSSTNAATAIPLPRRWPERVKSAILHTISLAHLAITHARGWAADTVNPRNSPRNSRNFRLPRSSRFLFSMVSPQSRSPATC